MTTWAFCLMRLCISHCLLHDVRNCLASCSCQNMRYMMLHLPSSLGYSAASSSLNTSCTLCHALLQEELGLLRSVWDMAGKVLGTFKQWYATPWSAVDVDTLLEQARALSKDVKGLSKAVRLYDAYQ